jgi:predicted dehydrogenase
MKLNIGLIGFGKIGNKIFNELKQSKKVRNIYILKKNKANHNDFQIFTKEKKFFKNKIDIFFISTPTNSHYYFLKKIIKKKKNFFIEKPFVENENELKQVKNIKKFRKNIFVNYIDIYNPSFSIFDKQIKKIGKIEKVDINIGKYQKFYKCNTINYKNLHKLPFFDWLPHPISTILYIFKKKPIVTSFKNNFFKKGNFLFQKLKISFHINKLKINLSFSNFEKKSKREILIYGKKYKLAYMSNKNSKNISVTEGLACVKKFNLQNKLIFKHENKKKNIHYVVDSVLKNKNYKNNLKFNIQIMETIYEIGKNIIHK